MDSLDKQLQDMERKIILDALTTFRWNRTRTAKELGITFRALRYRLHKLGIEDNGAGQRHTPKGFSKVWPKLREAAFAVHGHQCKQCGAKASEGAKLHIDHIKPVKHWPELALDLSNLQVLCAPCNLNKSDKIYI